MSKFYDKHGSSSDDSLSAFLDNEATLADIEQLLASDPMHLAQKIDRYQDIHQALQPDAEVLISDSGDFLAQMHRKMEQTTQESKPRHACVCACVCVCVCVHVCVCMCVFGGSAGHKAYCEGMRPNHTCLV